MIASTLLILAVSAAAEWEAIDCVKVSVPENRLACYDEKAGRKPDPKPAAAVAPEPATDEAAASDAEAVRAAVDQMLSTTLLDPTSAIQYEVSGPMHCAAVLPPSVRKMKGGSDECACYRVNSKNRMGGYTGQTLRTAALLPPMGPGTPRHAMDFVPVEGREGVEACFAAGLTDRPASRISELVKH